MALPINIDILIQGNTVEWEFPAIYDALDNNGSPNPVFETDEENTYFLCVIPVHTLADKTYVKSTSKSGTVLIINNIEDIISFANQATNQVTDQANDQVNDQANDQANVILNQEVHSRVKEMLTILQKRVIRADLFEKMGLKNHSDNREKYLDPLLKLGWVEMEFPDKRTSPKQTYEITASGKRILSLLNRI